MSEFLDWHMDNGHDTGDWLLDPEEDEGYHDYHVGVLDDGRWYCDEDCPHPDHGGG